MAVEDFGLTMVSPMADEVGNREEFGYENFLQLRSNTLGAHIILGDVVPSTVATWDNAPISSMFINTGGGDGTTLYLKESTGGTGWAPVTTGVEA